jgi:uncharacterized phiE125 gp8 family phage protein
MNLSLSTRRLDAPTSEPVTLAQVKSFLRIEHTAEDSLLQTLIIAARETAENMLNRSFLPQSFVCKALHSFPSEIKLLFPPVTVLTSLKRYNDVGEATDLPLALLTLAADGETLRTNAQIDGVRIELTYQAAWAPNAAALPAALQMALLQHVAQLYSLRAPERGEQIVDLTHIYAGLREVRV